MAAAEAPTSRQALIVATDTYADAKLRALRAPARDAAELARVLGDPDVGAFDVHVSLNEPDHVVRRRLSEFFADRGRDDLLLLHISCHGLKDEDGTLYFAASNTTVAHLEATAVPSEFVNRQMTRSRSRRIVLLLDCCFGGAFARGMVHRADESVGLKEEFGGQGRVVLTASRAMEYAFEGDAVAGEARPSIFTSAVVEGLATGRADRDGDSRVSVDELYDYVYDRVREETPHQTPSKWTFDVHGDLYVARNPLPPAVPPAQLPVELRAALESPFANVRAGAAEELASLLHATDAGAAAAARHALEKLAEDDSRRVSEAAERILGRTDAEERPPAAPPTSRRRSSTSTRVAVSAARAAGWNDGLALAGAAALVIAYFLTASWTSAWGLASEFSDLIWELWSPLEAFGVAVLAAAAVLARRSGRIPREGTDGLLLGTGVVAGAGALALGGAFSVGGAAIVTALGALALGGAGLLGIATRRAREAPLSRPATVVAAAGLVLSLTTLVVDFAWWQDTGLLDYRWPWNVEAAALALAGGLACLALLRVPRLRVHAAGLLVALGVAWALHVVGLLAQIAKYNSVGDLRLGGVLGIAGGALLVAAGWSILRARPREAPAAPGVPVT